MSSSILIGNTMTILVPFIDTNNVIGLAADRIYSPFSKPQFMTGSKVFERDDFVWGATGDISIVDYRTQEINNFADFVDNFKATKGDCVIVAVHDNQVYSIDLNMEKPVFHNNTKSDEPLAWGCFKHMFGECFDAFIVNSKDEVVQFIRTLHSMYGYDGESTTDHTLVVKSNNNMQPVDVSAWDALLKEVVPGVHNLSPTLNIRKSSSLMSPSVGKISKDHESILADMFNCLYSEPDSRQGILDSYSKHPTFDQIHELVDSEFKKRLPMAEPLSKIQIDQQLKSGTPRVALDSNTIQMIALMLASAIKEQSVCTVDEWKELTESINKYL